VFFRDWVVVIKVIATKIIKDATIDTDAIVFYDRRVSFFEII